MNHVRDFTKLVLEPFRLLGWRFLLIMVVGPAIGLLLSVVVTRWL